MHCPNDDDVSSYLAGVLAASDATAIAAHIASCRMCEQLVEVLGSSVRFRSATGNFASAPTLAAGSAPTTPLDQTVVPREGSLPRAGDSVGDYVLQRRVGVGGMGVVWEAYDPELDRVVALKLMRDAADHLRARFDREVRITARLQHPSIVSIFEAASWRGEPYYVMKLVRGESLDRVLAARVTSDARLALLPVIIAVVDALAYAHGERVIHRDLKPENVLVGEFGEAVVIDWGLAKSLAEPRPSSGDLATTATSGATVAGSVIGTPAYMPPEQARGEELDARADVYALGALLYCLLSGSRPYGDVADDMVAAVVAGPPRPLPRSAPRELAAIVAKSMARDRDDRFSSAKELAEELKRFQTGQLVASHRYTAGELARRWLRRHRAAVAVAGVALTVLASASVIGVQRIVDERDRATEQQLAAEARGAEVEGLLTFMLTELRQPLAAVGRLSLLEKMANRAESYFEGPHAGELDPRVRCRALIAVGEVLLAKGAIKDAIARYSAAEQIARAHLGVAPDDKQWWRELAHVDTKLGIARHEQGDLPGAAAVLREVLAIASWHEVDDLYRATAHGALGAVLMKQGDWAGALAQQRVALGLREQLAARTPADPLFQHDVASAHNAIGALMQTRGDLAGAEAEQRAAIAIMVKVVAATPGATELAHALALLHSHLAGVLAAKGDRPGSLTEVRRAVEIHRQVGMREPQNAVYREDLGNSLSLVAFLVMEQSPNEALELCREARSIRESLAALDPTNVERQKFLLASSQQIANILQGVLKRPADAAVEIQHAISIGEQLVKRDPTNTEWQYYLSLSYAVLGESLQALGKRDDAIAAQRAALALTEKLVASDPRNVDWKIEISYRRASIGDVLRPVDRAASETEYRTALAVVDELLAVQKNPAWVGHAAALRKKLAR